MEIRLTNHAVEGIEDAGLTHADVASIIEHPERSMPGETADQYDATVRGILYRVIVVKGSKPPLIITVFEVK